MHSSHVIPGNVVSLVSVQYCWYGESLPTLLFSNVLLVSENTCVGSGKTQLRAQAEVTIMPKDMVLARRIRGDYSF